MNNEVDVNVLRKLYDVLKNPRTLDMRFFEKAANNRFPFDLYVMFL